MNIISQYFEDQKSLEAVRNNGLNLATIEHQTPKICKAAINQNPMALEFVKEQTPELCLQAVSQNGETIKFVKEQTPETCNVAIKQNPYSLEYVKEQTPELCMQAVRQNGFALVYVKEQTPEICLEAVGKYGMSLEFVEEQNLEICLKAVTQNPYSLEYVKEQTPQICQLAVQKDSLCIMSVKEQTPEICIEAVKDDGFNLQYIKKQTPEICLSAVQRDPLALQFVNDQTPDVCIAAIKGDVEAFKYVKEQTPDVCLELVRKDAFELKQIKNQTPEICMEAVKQDSLALMYVKEQTPEICLAAVQKNGRTLHEVKEQTHDLCMVAVKEDGYALAYVKEQTPDMCLISVKQDGLNLQFVKEQTPQICFEAVKQNPEAGQFIKEITPESIRIADADKLLEISKSENVIGSFYELNNNNLEDVYKFTDRNGLTELFIKAEDSYIEVSDHDRFVSNYFEDADTNNYPNREDIEKDFKNAQNSAIEDSKSLKQAVSQKLENINQNTSVVIAIEQPGVSNDLLIQKINEADASKKADLIFSTDKQDLNKEFINSLSNRNFDKLDYFEKVNFKPSETTLQMVQQLPNLTDNEKGIIKGLYEDDKNWMFLDNEHEVDKNLSLNLLQSKEAVTDVSKLNFISKERNGVNSMNLLFPKKIEMMNFLDKNELTPLYNKYNELRQNRSVNLDEMKKIDSEFKDLAREKASSLELSNSKEIFFVDSLEKNGQSVEAISNCFKEKGYSIEVHAVAVHPDIAELNAYNTFAQEVTNKGTAQIPDTLKFNESHNNIRKTIDNFYLNKSADKISIYSVDSSSSGTLKIADSTTISLKQNNWSNQNLPSHFVNKFTSEQIKNVDLSSSLLKSADKVKDVIKDDVIKGGLLKSCSKVGKIYDTASKASKFICSGMEM